MRKLVRITLILAVIVVVAVGFEYSREPIYHGRRLRDWIADTWSDYRALTRAREAVYACGTNAIPYYLRLLRTKPDSPFKTRVLGTLERYHLRRDGSIRNENPIVGYRGLLLLGSKAEAAVPALTDLTRTGDAEVRSAASMVLVYSGVAGAKALAALLTDPNAFTREVAAFRVSCYFESAKYDEWIPRLPKRDDSIAAVLVPALIIHATDADQQTRIYSIYGLGAFAKQPEAVVPLLIGIARNTGADPRTKTAAIIALGKFGSNAVSSTAVLLSLFNLTNREISQAAGNALVRIDTNAAAVVVDRYSRLIQDRTMDMDERRYLIMVLNDYGTTARGAVPALSSVIHRDKELCFDASRALVAIDPETAILIGVDFMEIVRHSGNGAPFNIATVQAIGRLGSGTKSFIDPLIYELRFGDGEQRREAGIALKKIAPEEAAKAGVE